MVTLDGLKRKVRRLFSSSSPSSSCWCWCWCPPDACWQVYHGKQPLITATPAEMAQLFAVAPVMQLQR